MALSIASTTLLTIVLTGIIFFRLALVSYYNPRTTQSAMAGSTVTRIKLI